MLVQCCLTCAIRRIRIPYDVFQCLCGAFGKLIGMIRCETTTSLFSFSWGNKLLMCGMIGSTQTWCINMNSRKGFKVRLARWATPIDEWLKCNVDANFFITRVYSLLHVCFRPTIVFLCEHNRDGIDCKHLLWKVNN
jgi:hypothetical protein